jgi:hypothetical protein
VLRCCLHVCRPSSVCVCCDAACASVPLVFFGSFSTPTHAVSAPDTPTISLSFAPFGQYPVAHRPSVPRWLAGGSRAVSTPACESGPSLDGLRPTTYSGQRVQRPSERASSLSPPSESQRRYPGPVARLPRITGHRPPSLPAGPAPRTSALHRAAGSARTPTQARASATGGFEHRPTSVRRPSCVCVCCDAACVFVAPRLSAYATMLLACASPLVCLRVLRCFCV